MESTQNLLSLKTKLNYIWNFLSCFFFFERPNKKAKSILNIYWKQGILNTSGYDSPDIRIQPLYRAAAFFNKPL